MPQVTFAKGKVVDIKSVWNAIKIPILALALFSAAISVIVLIPEEVSLEFVAIAYFSNLIITIGILLYAIWNGVKKYGFGYEESSIAAVWLVVVAATVGLIVNLLATIYFSETGEIPGILFDTAKDVVMGSAFYIVLALICTFALKRLK